MNVFQWYLFIFMDMLGQSLKSPENPQISKGFQNPQIRYFWGFIPKGWAPTLTETGLTLNCAKVNLGLFPTRTGASGVDRVRITLQPSGRVQKTLSL